MNRFIKERRGALALAVSATTLAGAAAIATWSPANIIANAVWVLILSLAGFHAAVWLSYERKIVWQALDYALESVTAISLIAALAGIQQSSLAEMFQSEFSRRKAEQAQLVYSLKSTVTNDCHPLESRKGMWTPSPEPYAGACDRMEHFLPQIEFAFGRETGAETMTSDDSWAQNIVINDAEATGSWRGLFDEAKRFREGSRRTKQVLGVHKELSSGFIKSLAGSGKLQQWQYLLALVLGLRIARRTGGLLDARAKETRARPGPEPKAVPTPQQEASRAGESRELERSAVATPVRPAYSDAEPDGLGGSTEPRAGLHPQGRSGD